jgi:hypothetical protein
MVKLHALSISRWKHDDASIKEAVHLCFAVDLSQLSFFQVYSQLAYSCAMLRNMQGFSRFRRIIDHMMCRRP